MRCTTHISHTHHPCGPAFGISGQDPKLVFDSPYGTLSSRLGGHGGVVRSGREGVVEDRQNGLDQLLPVTHRMYIYW